VTADAAAAAAAAGAAAGAAVSTTAGPRGPSGAAMTAAGLGQPGRKAAHWMPAAAVVARCGKRMPAASPASAGEAASEPAPRGMATMPAGHFECVADVAGPPAVDSAAAAATAAVAAVVDDTAAVDAAAVTAGDALCLCAVMKSAASLGHHVRDLEGGWTTGLSADLAVPAVG